MKKLLFTDLDGTLLDLETYSADQVKESVEHLKKAGISIIFCSSKTWEEQKFYLHELNLNEPAIVENGSGLFLPKDFELKVKNQEQKETTIRNQRAIILGKSYKEVLSIIETNVNDLGLKFYANQSVEEIAELTGLSIEAARNAKSRNFSETLFNVNPESTSYQDFEKSLNDDGFQCIPGSRYVTVTGSESNKGTAVNLVIEAYKSSFDEVISFGVGDSRNDFEMLEAVDFPYLVQKPDYTWATMDIPNLSKVAAVGPAGWNIMAKEILSGW